MDLSGKDDDIVFVSVKKNSKSDLSSGIHQSAVAQQKAKPSRNVNTDVAKKVNGYET